MTDALKTFLEMNLPKVSKKKKEGKAASFSLGVIDSGLANAISEGIPGISVRSDDIVREISRGARLHLTSLVKGLENGGINQAQLGLGHSYSRGKVKFNPARSDNMIIQSIALLDQMDKDLNTFAMRVREWYSWHFPELKDLVKDNYMFVRCAAFIQDKKTLFHSSDEEDAEMDGDSDKTVGLTEIVGDEEMANSIIAAAKTSMGMECSAVDMINIINFTQRMVKLAEFRKQLALYLTDKMAIVAPNLSTLIGDTVGARLISKAGSLTNLAKAPASTVQILGAEKALFRALKTKGNTPKYGLIFHSSFIARAGAKNKGRISRYLANKCTIATRIDCFSENSTSIFGTKMKQQVEDRLKFYETGDLPPKNVDVMKEALDEAAAEVKANKKKEKKKKRKAEDGEDAPAGDTTMETSQVEENGDVEQPAKKKKKKKDKENGEAMDTTANETLNETQTADDATPAKKKKKKKDKAENGEEVVENGVNGHVNGDAEPADPTSEKKKKKKKKKDSENGEE